MRQFSYEHRTILSLLVWKHVNDSAPCAFPELEEESGDFLKQNDLYKISFASIRFIFTLLIVLITISVTLKVLSVYL